MTATPTRPRMTVLAAAATIACALSFMQVFNGGGWFWPAVAAALVASAGCALGRQLRLPRPLVPVIGFAGLALLLTAMHARDVAPFGLWPGPGAIRELNALAQTGFTQVRKFAVPAPPSEALVFLVAAGVGAVAVVVDTLAVTFRSAALAGLGLLALYAVPVAVVKHGVSWELFVVGAAFWLLLMLAEGRERLAGWGRALGRRSSRGDDVFSQSPAEPLGVVGRRIGVAALGLAVIVPAILPTFSSGLFSVTASNSGCCGSGPARSTSEVVNPFVAISGQLHAKQTTKLLTYATNDPNPDYLRMVTLDTFDGKTWLPASLHPSAAVDRTDWPIPSQLTGTAQSTTITIQQLRESWLPVAYPVTGITNLSGNWNVDDRTLDIFAGGGTDTLGALYTVTSSHPTLSAQDLRDAPAPDPSIVDAYTKLPTVPSQVLDATRTAIGSLTNEYDKAMAIQQFFSEQNGFSYSTDVPASSSPLVSFLNNKKGFCQQFAGTFAVMARLAHLPTRIDVGFTPGSQVGPGVWQVTDKNAHAWPEVYFSGYGWVRFEPTPGTVTGERAPGWAPNSTTSQSPGRTAAPSTGPSAAPSNAKDKALNFRDAPGGRTAAVTPTPSAAPEPFPWALMLAMLLVLLVALAPATVRQVIRRRRLRGTHAPAAPDPATGALIAWQEVRDTSRDLGWNWSRARTPRDTAAWLATHGTDEQTNAAALRLAGAVGRARYGRTPDAIGTNVAHDARVVVRGMLAASTSKALWRARLWPVSVLTPVASRFADAFDAIDQIGPRLRGSLGRFGRSGAGA
jgi:transglutaminase-like putative cysteine protease